MSTAGCFSVSALGIVVAVVLRGQMQVRDSLIFPAGVATAETVREIHSAGREAGARVRMLAGALSLSAGIKLFDEFALRLPRVALPFEVGVVGPGGGSAIGAKQLGFVVDPSLLMVGFGAIIGLRSGLSLLFGALVAWLGLAPWLIAEGIVAPGEPDATWFGALVEWTLWPGVTLMTIGSLASLLQSLAERRRRTRTAAGVGPADAARRGASAGLPVAAGPFAVGACAVAALAVYVQASLFGIPVAAGVVSVLLAFALAVVAARVVGETGIPPIGAIGKVAQLGFGITSAGNVTVNLMGANVTGGAAGQCADLLDDLRCGQLLGTAPGVQVLAQCFGVLVGSLVGSLSYLILIPDPHSMLLTAAWPAPAVATWKAVAEVLAVGVAALPSASVPAMGVAAVVGLGLSIGERRLPRSVARWLPSAPATGLAFVIPASIAMAMCFGALLAALASRIAPGWAGRFVLAIAACRVAGESLAGIAAAMMSFAGA